MGEKILNGCTICSVPKGLLHLKKKIKKEYHSGGLSQIFTFFWKLARCDAASSRALLFTAYSAQNFFAPFSPRRNFLVSFVEVRTQSTSLGNTY